MDEYNQQAEPAEPEVIETVQYDDYWSFSETQKYFLPDGQQWIEFQVMNEGQKSAYQKMINRDIKINRRSGDASIRSDIADERHALIEKSVVNWNMRQGNNFVKYSDGMLRNWLGVANPRIVEALETAIRKANPWLQGDMTVEDIDEEIARLQDQRELVIKENEGKELLSAK